MIDVCWLTPELASTQSEHDPRELLGSLRARLRQSLSHEALVAAFIAASEIGQGLADAECTKRGADARGPLADASMRLLVELARAIGRSWDGERPRVSVRMLAELEAATLPSSIRPKCAEGYAFYALYPEAYMLAARRARPATHVIGMRSIGMGLAALVAAAQPADTPTRLPVSVRPIGDPIRREIQVARTLLDEWFADRRATFAVVDDGPGLSGSSFGAVTDVLAAHGVKRERIECFPSHTGELGPVACERHRRRWKRLARHVVTMDELLLESGRLASWIENLVGPLTGPLEDISAGAWRAHHYNDEATYPPVVVQQERRKLLARTRDGTWLARFVGLGRVGEAALERARELSAAGFTPEVAGLCHGFLIERWYADARPLDRCEIDRNYLLESVGGYLGLRAMRRAQGGTCLAKQIVMLRRNVTLGIDAATAARIATEVGSTSELESRRQPVEIDGRLHIWEWLVRADGTLLKTDAYDHHAAHDLIGCQDISWDLAGAAVELALTPREQREVAAIVGSVSGRVPDPALVRVARPCYVAFQLGRSLLATETAAPREASRLRAAAASYAALLRR